MEIKLRFEHPEQCRIEVSATSHCQLASESVPPANTCLQYNILLL